MTVLASEQVQAWLVALPPDIKRRVRLALRALAEGKGDIKALRGELEGCCRLRVGGLRIVYRHLPLEIGKSQGGDELSKFLPLTPLTLLTSFSAGR